MTNRMVDRQKETLKERKRERDIATNRKKNDNLNDGRTCIGYETEKKRDRERERQGKREKVRD